MRYIYINMYICIYTLVANRSEHNVSLKCSAKGDMFTNMSVLQLPPSEFLSSQVSLEFLYGIWLPSFLLTKACITSPNELRLLLIACVSLSRSPTEPDKDSLSEPARSIKFKIPDDRSPVFLFSPVSCNVNTLWLLDDLSFKFVAPVARFWLALLSIVFTLDGESSW
jgi:hypothetical protein